MRKVIKMILKNIWLNIEWETNTADALLLTIKDMENKAKLDIFKKALI